MAYHILSEFSLSIE